MSRSPIRTTLTVALVGAATLAAVPDDVASAVDRERPTTIVVDSRDDATSMTPIDVTVAAQLHWWCLDQPTPTPCL